MKYALCVLMILFLAACQPPGGPKGPGRPPVSAGVQNARGLYLQTSTAKGMHAKAGLLAGATLMQVPPSLQPGPVTFTDAQGAETTVTVQQVIQASPTVLLLKYSWETGSGSAFLDLGTGALIDVVTLPDNWGMVRALNGQVYWITGGVLYRTDPATGISTAMTSTSDVYLNSSAWLHVIADGTVFSFYEASSQQFRIALASGGPTLDAGGSSQASHICTDLGFATTNSEQIMEDAGSNSVYLVGFGLTTDTLSVKQIIFDDTQALPFQMIADGTTWTWSVTGSSAATHIGGDDTAQASTYADTNGNVYAFTIAAGVPSATVWSAGSVPRTAFVGSTLIGGVQNWQANAGVMYYGPTPSSDDLGNVVLPGGGGTATTANTITVPGVTAWIAVGGLIFYADASGTFDYNTSTGVTTNYGDTSISIVAVTR